MASTDLISQCFDWTKQMIDKNQEVMVDIRVGDFKFSFDNKKYKLELSWGQPKLGLSYSKFNFNSCFL